MGVLHHVGRGVSGRKGDGDHEVRGGEAKQHEDEQLALPARKQRFEHRDRAFAVGTFLGDPAVNRQRAEKGQQNEDQRRDRGKHAGRDKGDSGLVAERREVIDARQTHHLPPRVLVMAALLFVRALDFFNPLIKPFLKPGLFSFFHIRFKIIERPSDNLIHGLRTNVKSIIC